MDAPVGIRTRVICLEGRDSTTELPAPNIVIYDLVLKFTKMPEVGFEPTTSSLGGKRSIQAELLGQ